MMRLINHSLPFSFVTFLFISFIALDVTNAVIIPGIPLRRTTFLHSLSDRLFSTSSLSSSSPASKSSGSLTSYINSRPELIETFKHYEDQVVIRFNITSARQEATLRDVVDRMLFDIWGFTNDFIDIRLPKHRIRHLVKDLPSSLHDKHYVLIPDLARAAAATYPSHPGLALYGSPEKQDITDVFFHDYQTYTAINAWMSLVDSMFRSRGFVKMITIGKSSEGRDIQALRVGMSSREEDFSGRQREVILVTGGIHAREWIGTSSVNYVAWSFIKSMDTDPLVKKILERFDLVFIPLLNPDGYEYTWDVDRLWRKTRQRTKVSSCRGFDLDHSFSYKWGSGQHQSEACSESYGGDEPFQAFEAAQLADWAKRETDNGSKFIAYIDLHSYSQQVLVPYSFSCSIHPPNEENLEEVAMNLAKHMRLSSGEVYTVASACEGVVTPMADVAGPLVEARGGSAVDYVYHELGAHYSYQIKLRDTGMYGFLLPSNNIVPTGEEVFHAMKYLGDYLRGNNGHEWTQENSPDDEKTGQETFTNDEDDVITELRRRRQ